MRIGLINEKWCLCMCVCVYMVYYLDKLSLLVLVMQAIEPVDSPCLGRKLARRRLLAQHLLTGEVRVLKSAIAWLENYCEAI